MTSKFEITKRFTFEAAHRFTHMPDGHPYGRLHGHSFEVEVCVEGTRDADHGWVLDFDEMDRVLGALREQLCHGYLNDIEGLDNPSLENISFWIAERAGKEFPGLKSVTVRRPTCNESCTFKL